MVIGSLPDSTTTPNGIVDSVLDRVRTFTTIVTPDRAAHILEKYNWPRQRTLRSGHVDYLRSCIDIGEITDISLIFVRLPDGGQFLVDGQHRLHALVQAEVSLPASVTVYAVDDESQIAERYLKIDRQTTRGPADALRATGLEERADVPPSVLQRIGSAAIIVESRFSRSFKPLSKSMLYRARVTEMWLQEGLAYHGYLSGAASQVHSMLWRQPVAAVALATIRFQPDLAKEFWTNIALEDRLHRDDPRGRLLFWLRERRIGSVKGEILYARHVAAAWNAFYEGRELKLLKVSDPKGPMRIMGTPYGNEAER